MHCLQSLMPLQENRVSLCITHMILHRSQLKCITCSLACSDLLVPGDGSGWAVIPARPSPSLSSTEESSVSQKVQASMHHAHIKRHASLFAHSCFRKGSIFNLCTLMMKSSSFNHSHIFKDMCLVAGSVEGLLQKKSWQWLHAC